jgi:hypothetical protein
VPIEIGDVLAEATSALLDPVARATERALKAFYHQVPNRQSPLKWLDAIDARPLYFDVALPDAPSAAGVLAGHYAIFYSITSKGGHLYHVIHHQRSKSCYIDERALSLDLLDEVWRHAPEEGTEQ